MKKDKRNTAPSHGNQLGFTIIDKGTEIEGDIITEKNIKLNGRFKGKCISKRKVIISDQCQLEGTIEGQFVDIYGKVNGDINADNLLFIASTAMIEGKCFTKKIKIDEGAVIKGNINMKRNGE